MLLKSGGIFGDHFIMSLLLSLMVNETLGKVMGKRRVN